MLAGFRIAIPGLVIGRKRDEQVGFAVVSIVLSCIPLAVNIVIGAVFGNMYKVIISQMLPVV